MSNPLTRKRQLEPIQGINTQEDIESRLRGAMHPGETILSKNTKMDFRPQASLNSNLYKTSAPLHMNIADDDRLPPDTKESKTAYESLVFDPLTRDPLEHFTFVESLKTGKFLRMMKKNITFEDTKEEYIPLSLFEREKQIYLKLQLWALRLHKLFLVIQGFLAGVALLHIYLLYFSTADKTFVDNYGQLARIIGFMFHVLIFFALVGSIIRSINERKHYRHMQLTEYNFDTDLHRLPFYISIFCVVCYAIAYSFTTFTAKVDNEMHFRHQLNETWTDTSSTFDDFVPRLRVWSILCIIRDILVILAWIVFCTQSHWNVGSIFLFKIQIMQSDSEDNNKTQADEDYKHLFYGNPYLPHGVYQVVIKDKKDNKDKKEDLTAKDV